MSNKTISDSISAEFVPSCGRLVSLDNPQATEIIYSSLKHGGYHAHIADICGEKKALLISAINGYCRDDLAFADVPTLQAIERLIDDCVACIAEF